MNDGPLLLSHGREPDTGEQGSQRVLARTVPVLVEVDMILRMLRTTEWGRLLDFVSRSFFEVLPPGGLAAAARDRIASSRNGAGMRAAFAAAST